MTVPCATVTVAPTAANIVPTILSISTCNGVAGCSNRTATLISACLPTDNCTCTLAVGATTCTVNGEAVWTNSGGTTGTFTPAVSIDGGVPIAISAPVSLLPGTDALQSFSVQIPIGTHTIRTDPGTFTATITVVAAPANITATNITVTPPTCTAPCNVSVSATWTNNGGTSGNFVPNISIDGVAATPVFPSEALAPGISITHAFSVTGLTAATHTICPIPN